MVVRITAMTRQLQHSTKWYPDRPRDDEWIFVEMKQLLSRFKLISLLFMPN